MKQHDFTQGGLWRQLVVFSLPIMATNLLQVSYQFVDSLWVGNLIGASALGAVAVSSVVIFTILSFIIGLNNAALTILSQQKGKKDESGLARYLNAFVVLMTLLSAALGLLGYVSADSLLRLLGTPADMLHDARVYLQINCLGILFLFGYNFIGTVMRSLGDSRTPLHFVMAAVVLNAMLDPLFIAGFGWGVQGAAAATIVSQGLAFLYGLFVVLSKRLAPFTWPRLPAREEIALILRLGIPAGLQMAVISAGAAAIMSVVTSFGEQVVAGFSAAQRLDSVIMLPAQALGTAVNSMAGQNIGIRRWERVSRIARYGVLYNLFLMLAIAVVIFFCCGVGRIAVHSRAGCRSFRH
ncbi:hypothetical protein XYCOK13_16080 [Xylanibacillus composti]|uniref:MATE family efflux protein n=1 Tax=Xylanibacillus composti TaxID=1572762 RepID=A0A8J4H4K8_9BACL|nr:hypothetical protein XYCOK13_16080 [Xylanibacillus composti]